MLCWRYKICSCLTGDALRWWAWTPVERLAGVARQQRGGRGVLDLCPRFPPASAMASSVICCSCPFLREALFIYTLGFGKPAAGRLFPPEEWYLGVSDTLYLVNFVSYLWPTFVSYIWPTLSPICGQLLSHISDQLCLLFVANFCRIYLTNFVSYLWPTCWRGEPVRREWRIRGDISPGPKPAVGTNK